MTSHELNDIYFDWMLQLVCDGEHVNERDYYKLFSLMHGLDYIWSLPMDGNRAADGVSLRYRFGYEHGIDQRIIASELDYKPCSVLEMLIALVVRCEENIMVDLEVGNRFGRWFWMIMENLGLDEMTDDDFDFELAHYILCRMMARDYEPDGKYGPIYIPGCDDDLRSIDIWGQMMRYLSTIII